MRTKKVILEDIQDGEIILMDVDFIWEKSDITNVIRLWKNNRSLKYIAKEMEREIDEVFLLLLHLARQNRIEKRNSYIWGVESENTKYYYLLNIDKTARKGYNCYLLQTRYGYTVNEEKAGLFTQEEALTICRNDKRNQTVMLPYISQH